MIPGGSTLAEPSSGDLSDLVDTIDEFGVPAIFADTSSSAELADVLAEETGEDIAVVELFSESLGEPGSGGETYLELIRTNADRILEALRLMDVADRAVPSSTSCSGPCWRGCWPWP